MCPQSYIHKWQNCVPLIIPSLSSSLPLSFLFFMPFSFLPQYPPFSSPSFCSAVAMTTAALHHSSVGDLGSCSCRESAPLTSIHNTLSANAVTEANEELSPICAHGAPRREKAPCAVFIYLFFPFSFVVTKVSVTCQPSVLLPSQRCHLCVPQRLSDCCVLPSSFPFPPSLSFLLLLLLSLLPSLPYLPDSVSFTAIELSGQHQHWNLWRFPQKGNKREERRASFCSSTLDLPLLHCRCFSLLLFSFLLSFYLIFDELVIAQGGRTARVAGGGRRGAGAVPQPSGMRDLVWEWWAPATPSSACFIPPSVPANCVSPLSPAAPPLARPGLAPALSAVASHSWSGRFGHWFEWCLYRQGANGRSAGK